MADIIRTMVDQQGWRVGDIACTFQGLFNWAVILGFEIHGPGAVYAVLARPMLYAHDGGTQCATPLATLERYECRIEHLQRPPDSEWRKDHPPTFLIASEFVMEHRS